MQNRRGLMNILNQPSQQIRIVMAVVFCWAFIVVTAMIIFLKGTRDSLTGMGSAMGVSSDFILVIDNSFQTAMWAISLYICFLCIVLLLWLFTLSHRVFGPTVQLKKIIADFRAGNYSARGQLRKGDALQDIMEDLNMLGEDLERKKS